MNEQLQSVLKTIPTQPQRQDSTHAQARDLRAFANRLGMYDIADVLRIMTEKNQQFQD